MARYRIWINNEALRNHEWVVSSIEQSVYRRVFWVKDNSRKAVYCILLLYDGWGDWQAGDEGKVSVYRSRLIVFYVHSLGSH